MHFTKKPEKGQGKKECEGNTFPGWQATSKHKMKLLEKNFKCRQRLPLHLEVVAWLKVLDE